MISYNMKPLSLAGNVYYLSSTISEEIIEIMAKEVLAEICIRMKKDKYYSVSVDTTGRIHQLIVIDRYMKIIRPVERFLTLMQS